MALEPHGPDTFVGVGPRYPWGGLYGGQIVAQSLRAAGLTVDPAYLPHSLHAFFIRPGDHTEPIRFEVDRIRNGRSFATRRVVARQSIGAIFNMATSFQLPEDAVDVQPATLDPVVGSADDHPSDGGATCSTGARSATGGRPTGGPAQAWMRMIEPVERRPAPPGVRAGLPVRRPAHRGRGRRPSRPARPGERGRLRPHVHVGQPRPRHLVPPPARRRRLAPPRPAQPGPDRLARPGDAARSSSADGTHAATVTQEVLLRVRR